MTRTPPPASSPASGRRPARGRAAPRAWQRMLSGRRLDLLDPSPLDVEIEDIAHGLARVARWNGQTQGAHAFSVAQHSLVVEDIAARLAPSLSASDRLVALLHDAAEYVIGDMISPFKAALGLDYRDFEERLERAVHIRFGLAPITPAALRRVVKRADQTCAYFEAVQIAGFADAEARTFFGAPPADMDVTIAPVPPEHAQADFLARFHALEAAMGDGETPRARTPAR